MINVLYLSNKEMEIEAKKHLEKILGDEVIISRFDIAIQNNNMDVIEKNLSNKDIICISPYIPIWIQIFTVDVIKSVSEKFIPILISQIDKNGKFKQWFKFRKVKIEIEKLEDELIEEKTLKEEDI